MTKLLFLAFLLGAALSRLSASPAMPIMYPQSHPVPLYAAVTEFNKYAAARHGGKIQPPLTEAEVVSTLFTAANLHPELCKNPALLRKIAETHILPVGAEIDWMDDRAGRMCRIGISITDFNATSDAFNVIAACELRGPYAPTVSSIASGGNP